MLMNLRLRNISLSPVNHLILAFFDSTTPVLEEALASNTLPEDDASELEYYLYERPAFTSPRCSSPAALIDSNESEDLGIEVHGKRGLTHGSILVEYAYIENTS